MRKIERLEKALAQCQGPTATLRQPSNLNRSTVAIQIPADANEALINLKSEIAKSPCRDNQAITEKLSFLTAKIAGGTRRTKHTRRRKHSKSKKTRKH
jgi:hypothetical protein